MNTISELPSTTNPFEELVVQPTKYEEPTPVLEGFLYVGSERDAACVADLLRLGITHVLNAAHDDATAEEHICAAEGIECDDPYGCERQRVVPIDENFYRDRPALAHIQYMGLPLDDCPSQAIFPYFEATIRFIEGARRSSPLNRVLVFCANGISRSVALVTCFLMSPSGGSHSLYNAAKLIKSKRYIAGPNQGFVDTLIAFAKRRRATYLRLETGGQQQQHHHQRRGRRRHRAHTSSAGTPELPRPLQVSGSPAGATPSHHRQRSRHNSFSREHDSKNILKPRTRVHSWAPSMLGISSNKVPPDTLLTVSDVKAVGPQGQDTQRRPSSGRRHGSGSNTVVVTRFSAIPPSIAKSLRKNSKNL